MDRFHFARISGLGPGDEATLPEREAHHLRVKRARAGDRVRLFDGAGGEAIAEVLEAAAPGGGARLRIVEAGGGAGARGDGAARGEAASKGEAASEAEGEGVHAAKGGVPSVAVTLAVAMPKGKRDLLLVEKATELGVAALAPLVTRRTVGAARSASEAGRLAKWAATALEAAKQCGLSRLPEVRPSLRFEQALALEADVRLILDPRPGARPLRELLAGPRPATLLGLVGPEGGFTDEEVEQALARGFRAARLGTTVLRIETAAIALLAAAVTAWDG